MRTVSAAGIHGTGRHEMVMWAMLHAPAILGGYSEDTKEVGEGVMSTRVDAW